MGTYMMKNSTRKAGSAMITWARFFHMFCINPFTLPSPPSKKPLGETTPCMCVTCKNRSFIRHVYYIYCTPLLRNCQYIVFVNFKFIAFL